MRLAFFKGKVLRQGERQREREGEGETEREREREREREENEWQKVRYGEKDMKSTRGGRETGLVAGDALISFLMEGSVRGLGG